MWNRRPIGMLLTGSWVAFGVIEGIGIAVDQWFGHQADPNSSFASEGAIPLMLGMALVSLVGLYFFLRRPRLPRPANPAGLTPLSLEEVSGRRIPDFLSRDSHLNG
jgi:hypothetical protein